MKQNDSEIDGDPRDGQFRGEGDRHRDSRAWDLAARCYELHLSAFPDDQPIWIQRGHCLKELNKLDEALACYTCAAALPTENDDAHLHLGHVNKLLGRRQASAVHYATAVCFAPHNASAVMEAVACGILQTSFAHSDFSEKFAEEVYSNIRNCGQHKTSISDAFSGRLLIDISDLLEFFKYNRFPTGIQRVQMHVAIDMLSKSTVEVRLVAINSETEMWVEVPPILLAQIHRLSCADWECATQWAEVRGLTRCLISSNLSVTFVAHDRLLNIGTSWWVKKYVHLVLEAKKKFNIFYVPFLHDCIPLVVPQYCAAGLVSEFRRWFSSMALAADHIICNSKATQKDLNYFLRLGFGQRSVSSSVVRLDAVDTFGSGRDGPSEVDKYPFLLSKFILCVGTIEARKNHILIFKAWQRLFDAMPEREVPYLVVVGKMGWLAEGALKLLEEDWKLREKIIILSSVSDSYLRNLYVKCTFTIFASHYEGWGLPITESLAYGVVPLVADNSSLPEAGGSSAMYFKSNNLDDLVSKLKLMISKSGSDGETSESLTSVRTWGQVADDIHVASLCAISGHSDLHPTAMQLGNMVYVGDKMVSFPCSELGLSVFLMSAGWSYQEEWGAWTSALSAVLDLGIQPQICNSTSLYASIVAPPSGITFSIVIMVGGDQILETYPFRLNSGSCEIQVLLPTVQETTASLQPLTIVFRNIELVDLAPLTNGDERRVGVGLMRFALCEKDDIQGQLKLVQAGMSTPVSLPIKQNTAAASP